MSGQPGSLVELLRRRAELSDEGHALTFLEDGETIQITMSYRDLDARARSLAAYLLSKGIGGERLLLLYPSGLEFLVAFFGSLYAGCVAVPTFPPEPFRLQRTLGRILAIVKDCRPAAVLTIEPVISMRQKLRQQAAELDEMRWIATDVLPETLATGRPFPAVEAESVAFLQYTSGSTAIPKGVILTHRNLVHNLGLVCQALGVTSNSRFFSWMPLNHDMGLIGGILTPIYKGIPVVFMSPLHFVQRPVRWLEAIERYRITHSGGPNFAYELSVSKITSESSARIDLHSWEVAWNGAEPVRAETMERFVGRFAPCGFRPEAFYPCYGLAEATLIVSGGDKAEAPVVVRLQPEQLAAGYVVPAGGDEGLALSACGKTVGDQLIRIVDPQTRTLCPESQVGEIWVAGPSVAQGYWNLAEETRRLFQAVTADTGEGPFLRTGDLGFMQDGQLFIAGRLKDLIIVDGLNHYPQDIELTVEQSHPALRPGCSAAFSVDIDGRENVVVAVEVVRPAKMEVLRQAGVATSVEAITTAIKRSVSRQYDLPLYDVVLLEAGAIHKTSSGKIQRHACRAGYLAAGLRVWTGDRKAVETP